MTLVDFVILLVVAGICGAVGQAIVGYSRGGCLASIAVGFIGALLGAWLARAMNLPAMFQLVIGDQPFPIIWSIIGSALFVALIALITPRSTGWYRRRW
ncbi:MAG: GlsB/YeaQ/YmgE family stress response membrane protein [Gemmataceae bacterium]